MSPEAFYPNPVALADILKAQRDARRRKIIYGGTVVTLVGLLVAYGPLAYGQAARHNAENHLAQAQLNQAASSQALTRQAAISFLGNSFEIATASEPRYAWLIGQLHSSSTGTSIAIDSITISNRDGSITALVSAHSSVRGNAWINDVGVWLNNLATQIPGAIATPSSISSAAETGAGASDATKQSSVSVTITIPGKAPAVAPRTLTEGSTS